MRSNKHLCAHTARDSTAEVGTCQYEQSSIRHMAGGPRSVPGRAELSPNPSKQPTAALRAPPPYGGLPFTHLRTVYCPPHTRAATTHATKAHVVPPPHKLKHTCVHAPPPPGGQNAPPLLHRVPLLEVYDCLPLPLTPPPPIVWRPHTYTHPVDPPSSKPGLPLPISTPLSPSVPVPGERSPPSGMYPAQRERTELAGAAGTPTMH